MLLHGDHHHTPPVYHAGNLGTHHPAGLNPLRAQPQTPSRTVAGCSRKKVNEAAVLTETQELQQPRDPRRLSHPGCFFSQMFFTLPALQSLRSFPPRTRLWDEEAAPARWLTPSCHAFLLEFVSELNDLAPRIVAFFSSSLFFFSFWNWKRRMLLLVSSGCRVRDLGWGGLMSVYVVSLAVLLLPGFSLPLPLSIPAAVLCSGQSSVFSC